MIKLKLFGSAVLALGISYATLEAITANAASGDAVYIKKAGEVTLTTVQKSTAGTCMGQTFPELAAANVQRVYLQRDVAAILISACDKYTPTAEQEIALELAGRLGADLGTGQYERCLDQRPITGAQLECWAGLLVSTHPAISASTVVDYTLWRDLVVSTTVKASANYVVTATPDAWKADKTAGVMVKLLDQVR